LKIIANKNLGQNFLTNKSIINEIVNSINYDNSFIVEIGPGYGALTSEILKKTKNLLLIEIDSNLVDCLTNEFKDIKIINEDVLKINWKEIKNKYCPDKCLKIVSNTPYYISSQILFNLFENSEIISEAVLMMQKEVSQKLNPHNIKNKCNNLSIITEYFSDYKKIISVSKNNFYPIPNVDSEVFKLIFKKNTKQFSFKFYKFIRKVFNQKRKTILNNLKNCEYKKESIEKYLKFLNIDSNKRPEDLNLNLFLKIFLFLEDSQEYSYLEKSNAKVTLSLNVSKTIKNGMHDIEGIFLPFFKINNFIEVFESNKQFIKVINDECLIKDTIVEKLINNLKINKIIPKDKNFTIKIFEDIPTGAGLSSASSNITFVSKIISKILDINISKEWEEILYNISSDSLFFLHNELSYVTNFGKNYISKKCKTNLEITFYKQPYKFISKQMYESIKKYDNIGNLLTIFNKLSEGKIIDLKHLNNTFENNIINSTNKTHEYFQKKLIVNKNSRNILTGSGSGIINIKIIN